MKSVVMLIACIGGLIVAGCAEKPGPSDSSSTTVDGSKYLLESEPKEAAGVIKARETSKDKDEVVVIGRIGGRVDPWIKDRAAFTIVDPSLRSCDEVGADGCAKPWDFC